MKREDNDAGASLVKSGTAAAAAAAAAAVAAVVCGQTLDGGANNRPLHAIMLVRTTVGTYK